MMSLPFLRLSGAMVLCDDGLHRRPVTIGNGRVQETGNGPEVDLSGYMILPGIVDLNSASPMRHLVSHATPALSDALMTASREAAAEGVTTQWLAQSWSWEGGPYGPDAAEALMAEVQRIAPKATIDLRVQLRVETHMLENRARLLIALRKFEIGYVMLTNYLSRAFEMVKKDPTGFAIWAKRTGHSPETFGQLLHEVKDRQGEVPRHLCALAQGFDALGLIYGSHHDPDAETRESYRILGAHIAEVPLTEKAAAAAKAMDDVVLMPAPDLLRTDPLLGGSVLAQKLIGLGLCDALVSQDTPGALTAAVWSLVDGGVMTLPEAWSLVSARPAQIMGLTDRGTIAPGTRADLVILNTETRKIEATLSRGAFAYLGGNVAQRLDERAGGLSLAAE